MLKLLFVLSLRSLSTHRITTFIVGSIIFFGTWILVSGTALLDSLDRSLARSLISSVAGHLQVYSSTARDELALFGSGFSAIDDVGQMNDFGKVEQVLYQDDNVQAVVPMGIAYHALVAGNELDQLLGTLHEVAHERPSNNRRVHMAGLAHQVRDIAQDIEHEVQERVVIDANAENLRTRLSAVKRVQTPRFWHELDQDPDAGLQFLDTQLAPLAGSAPTIFLRNFGTDLDAFTQHFDRFRLIDGEMVPPQTRGFLFSKTTYEHVLKHPVARTLDEIARGKQEAGRTLENDAILRSEADRLPEQYKRIAFQLMPQQTRHLTTRLAAFLHVPDAADAGDISANAEHLLPGLLRAFLAVDDNNFQARYRFFYDEVAPMIHLYAVNVGDTMTLEAMTHSGYTKSVKVKVWGTYEFEGLDKSVLAGMHNLMDLVTFRDLYGAQTPDDQRELSAIKKSVNVEDIDRGSAEDEMFTDTTAVRAERMAVGKPLDLGLPTFAEAKRLRTQKRRETFTQTEMDHGLALNAAILLRDPSALEATRARLTGLVTRAGLPVRVVDWRAASGLVSRFVTVVHLFLYTATAIIFLAAVVIMSNAMTMATAERAREIGTIRAIGGQRRLVLVLYLLETLILGSIAGILGAIAGVLSIWIAGHQGIPAASDVLELIFSGPRLYPDFALRNVLWGIATVLVVTLISTVYPAHIATRVAPVVAMRPKE